MGRQNKVAENKKRPLVGLSGPIDIGIPHCGKERKRAQAIVALLSAPTVAEAAARVGIGYRTLKTWRTQPEFITEYRRVMQELLDATTGRLRRAMAGAVDVLEHVASDPRRRALQRPLGF
jgi:hypothetical protein